MIDHIDLFSGIGGFSLGLEKTGGFRTIAFVDNDPFCQRVLAKHWPDVGIFSDVREITWNENESSLEDSRVRTSPSRKHTERPWGYMENDQDSGSNTGGSSTKSGQTGESERTSKPYSIEDWTSFFAISPKSGMMRNGMLYPLPPLDLPSNETGSGSSFIPWGTPTVRDYKDSGNISGVPVKALLGRQVKSFAGKMESPGCVHPEFHLWVQGYDPRWNELEQLGTPSSRKSRRH